MDFRKEINDRINVLSLSKKLKNITKEHQFEISTFNSLVDAILLIADKLSAITKTEIDTLEITTSNMVEVLEILQGNGEDSLKQYWLNKKYLELVLSIDKLCNEIDKKLTLKIIICGSNKIIDFLVNKTNHQFIEIIGIVSNDETNYELYPKLNESSFDGTSYDLLILSDDKVAKETVLNFRIDEEKVINFNYYLNLFIKEYQNFYNKNYFHSMLYTRLAKIKRQNRYDTVVAGLSYSLRGVVEEEVNNNALKFALPSQDLYYDYLIIKDILESGVKLKYYILGVAYYSFDWDLSLTKQESERIIHTYYPIFNDSHNLKLGPQSSSYQGISGIQKNIDPLLILIFGEGIFEQFIEEYLRNNLTPDLDNQLWNTGTYLRESIVQIDNQSRRMLGKERADFHNKLNYPSSRIANTEILRNILSILDKNDVKPIVTIFPTTKYYNENFNSDTKDRFYNIINELSKEHKIQVIDLFDSDDFEVTDFVDWDHLNKQGASKMSKILNELIEW